MDTTAAQNQRNNNDENRKNTPHAWQKIHVTNHVDESGNADIS